MRKMNGIMVGCIVGWVLQACSPGLNAPDDGEAGENGTAVSRGGALNGGGATGKYSASSNATKGGSSSPSSSAMEAAQGGAGNSVSSSSSAGGNVSEVSSSSASGGSSAVESSKPGTGGSSPSGGSSAVGAGGQSVAGAGGSRAASTGGTSSTGGSSARGGASSVGGSSASLLANGQVCQGASQCSSNNCVDGYCCNIACDGVCATCSATPGTCTKPATDPACVSIANASYPSDTSCTDYTLTTTGGECSQLGTCAVGYTSHDFASRTSCSSEGALCNGAGECLRPKVTCGTGAFATSCDVGPGRCCREWSPGSTTSNLIPGVATCSSNSNLCPIAVGATLRPFTIRCNDADDCTLGSICCVFYSSMAQRESNCVKPSECVGAGTTGALYGCRSNSDCAGAPGNHVCTEDPAYPEVKVCK